MGILWVNGHGALGADVGTRHETWTSPPAPERGMLKRGPRCPGKGGQVAVRLGDRKTGQQARSDFYLSKNPKTRHTRPRALILIYSMIPTVIHSSPVAEYHHGQQPKHLDLPAISHAGAAGAALQAAHSLRSVGAGSRAKASTASLSVLASSSALRAGRRGSLDASAATRL